MSATGYVPHSEETKLHYENFLQLLRRNTPPGSESLENIANDALAILCSSDESGESDIAQKQQQLERLLGTPLTKPVRDQLLRYGKLISDYVVNAMDEDVPKGTSVLDGIYARSSSSSSEEDEIALLAGKDAQKKMKTRHDKRHLETYAFDDSAPAGQEEGFLYNSGEPLGNQRAFFFEDGEESLNAEPPIPFKDVVCNAAYLKGCLRRLFPSHTTDACASQAQRVEEYLSNLTVDSLTVETQLSAFLGGYDDEAVLKWIGEVCASRWEIVYGLKCAKTPSDKARGAVMVEMKEHAKQDRKVESLYLRLTGKEVDIVNARHANESASSERKPLRRINIASCIFLEERSPHQHARATVPQGTRRAVYETHDEVSLPPSSTERPSDTLVAVSELPSWCQPSFGSVERLNAMQSRAMPCAFESDENILISAPTGAGKTNVALLTMLRAIQNARNPKTGAINLHELKMVYIAPMKALVQEVVRTFTERLAPLGLQVSELSGDTATSQSQLMNTQLIVATPEKWDIITRKSVELGVASLLKLLIIDEVHLLHNERGAVLEAIVSRTFVQQQLRGQGGIRLVGLSATLPNWMDVASFLQVDRQKAVFVFDSSYRPIPLEQTFCAVKKSPGTALTSTMNSVVYDKVVDCAQRGEQSLVFVHSRKDTVFTAQYLLERARREHRMDYLVRPGSESESVLRDSILQVNLTPAMETLFQHGLGVHHAGMGKEERALVESLFADRHIKVLVCTSTLAWGVNLPANQVIIKGTRVFNSGKGESELLSALDVLQMFGRAGRIGFGSALGRAAIITSAEDLHYYLCVLNEQLPIESHLMKRVVNLLNAEVALGHIENTGDGVKWLQRTYFYVRLRQSPELYGTQASNTDPLFLHYLECLVHSCCEVLRDAQMVLYDPQTRHVSPTPFGRIASHCYITADSMSAFLSNLSYAMQDADVFRVFTLSSEFSQIAVRADEQSQLRELVENAPVAVRDSRYTTMAKINILLQCFISRKGLEGLPLMSEIGYVKDSAQRILRALYEICLQKTFGRTARQYLELYLMVVHRQWLVESPIRQVPDLLPVKAYQSILASVERMRVSWDEMRSWSVEDWAEKLNDDRKAAMTVEVVQAIPHYSVQASVRPLSRAMLYVDVDVTPDYQYHESIHSKGRFGRVGELVLMIEHNTGQILHSETIFVPLESIQHQWQYSCPPMVVPVTEPKPTHLYVRLMSPHWLHVSASTSVSLLNTLLPAISPPLREVPSGLSEEELDVCNVMTRYQMHQLAEKLFPFSHFYAHQRELVAPVMEGEESVFIALPPGGGKTVVAELFILQYLLSTKMKQEERDDEVDHSAAEKPRKGESHRSRQPVQKPKLLYITVQPEVADRHYMEWSYRFGSLLECDVFRLDALHSEREHLLQQSESNLIVTTGAELAPLVRREELTLLSDVTHIIVDHMHLLRSSEGRGLEVCVAKLLSSPYTSVGGRRPRLLAMSYPLISAVEVCKWLRIMPRNQFNFSNSCRQLVVRVEGQDLPSARSRYETGVMSVIQLLHREPHSAPAVLFVPTKRDAEAVAKRVLLRCREVPSEKEAAGNEDEELEDVEDPQLALLLAAGVAYLHSGTSPRDEITILERLDAAISSHNVGAPPLILVCDFRSVGRLPAAAFRLACVCSSERIAYHRPSAVSAEEMEDSVSSLSASELLQMVSRSANVALVFCPAYRRWLWSQLLMEPLPLESSLRYPIDFADSVNSAIALGRVRTKIDVLRLLQSHYFLYHLKTNPHFYGVPSADDIPLYASDLTYRVVQLLGERGCVKVEGEEDGEDNPHAVLRPLPRGLSAATNNILLETMELLDEGMEELASTSVLSAAVMWRLVCKSSLEIAALGPAVSCSDDVEECDGLFTLARLLPSAFGVNFIDLDFREPGMKLYLLGLGYAAGFMRSIATDPLDHPFSQAPLPPAELQLLLHIPVEVAQGLAADLLRVLPVASRVVRGVIPLLPGKAGWVPVEQLVHFHQRLSSPNASAGAWSCEEPGRRQKTSHTPLGQLSAKGAVTEVKRPHDVEGEGELVFTVSMTVELREQNPNHAASLLDTATPWWASCVASTPGGESGSAAADPLLASDNRVLTVQSVVLKGCDDHKPPSSLAVEIHFPVEVMQELNLEEVTLTAVLIQPSPSGECSQLTAAVQCE